MRVVHVKDIEDCFDGSSIKEFELDEKISKDFIKKLGQGYCLEYFSDFARPFFKIENENKFQLSSDRLHPTNSCPSKLCYRCCSAAVV